MTGEVRWITGRWCRLHGGVIGHGRATGRHAARAAAASVEVSPLAKLEGHFQGAIRRSGKLTERSDRPYRSEAKAHDSALEAIEWAMKPSSDFRGR